MIVVDNLTIEIQKKTIIHDFSHRFDVGKIYFLMSRSGKGKTSFFRALCRSIPYKGSIDYDPSHLDGFMDQDVHLFEYFTVTETLRFYNSLVYKTKLSDAFVLQYLTKFHLAHVLHTRIGNNISGGLSGGEKKRLVLACHLLRNNPILLFDEPLTGLDQEYQDEMMELILDHVRQYDNICIVSIHNPTPFIRKKMEYLLTIENGRMAFSVLPKVDTFRDIPLHESFLIPQERIDVIRSWVLFRREVILIQRDFNEFLGRLISIMGVGVLQNVILGPLGSAVTTVISTNNFFIQLQYFLRLLILFFTCSIFPVTFVPTMFKYLTTIKNEIHQGWFKKHEVLFVKFWMEMSIVFLLSLVYGFIVWCPIPFVPVKPALVFHLNILNQMAFSTGLLFLTSLTERYNLTQSSLILYNSFSFLFNIGYLLQFKNPVSGVSQLLSLNHLQTYAHLLALQEVNPTFGMLIKSISLLRPFTKVFEPLLVSFGYVGFVFLLYHMIILH